MEKTNETSSNFISHYGIPKRSGRYPWGSGEKNKTKLVSEDFAKAHALRKVPIEQMSNEELRNLNERLQLERTYANLNPKKVSKGKAITTRFLKSAGKRGFTELYNSRVKERDFNWKQVLAESAIESVFSDEKKKN